MLEGSNEEEEEYDEYDDGHYPEEEPLSALTDESRGEPSTLLPLSEDTIKRALTPGKRAYEDRDGDDLSEYEVEGDENHGSQYNPSVAPVD